MNNFTPSKHRNQKKNLHAGMATADNGLPEQRHEHQSMML